MLIARWIAGLSGRQDRLEDLIERITARCLPAVWGRVYPAAARMDRAEAQGYIRSRTRLVVARELHVAVSSLSKLSPSQRDFVKRAVSSRLVQRTLREISLRRPPRRSKLRAA